MTGAEDTTADDLLRSGYDRWLRLEEAKDVAAEDSKQFFAEMKGNGFTPKALRESFRRVRDADNAEKRAAADEHDALVDLYIASLSRAHPAPTRRAA